MCALVFTLYISQIYVYIAKTLYTFLTGNSSQQQQQRTQGQAYIKIYIGVKNLAILHLRLRLVSSLIPEATAIVALVFRHMFSELIGVENLTLEYI